MPLHNEARPQNLDKFFGNKGVVASLRTIIKSWDRPHTYLFQGPTGCGKTTLARILAKEFGCKDFDLIELNASNTRGIDTIRDIIGNSQYMPVYGKSKCYILDESHQLTPPAQEALLKIIEDAPENVYFFLCTTEPEKIIGTIRNRCATYSVRPLNPREMREFMGCIIEGLPGFSLCPEMFDLILNESKGCPRSALIFIEQIIGVEDIEKAKEIISETTLEKKELIELCRKIVEQGKSDANTKWIGLMKIYKSLNIEPEKTRRAVLGYLKSCLMNSIAGNAQRFSELMDIFSDNIYDDGEPKFLNMLFKASLKSVSPE